MMTTLLLLGGQVAAWFPGLQAGGRDTLPGKAVSSLHPRQRLQELTTQGEQTFNFTISLLLLSFWLSVGQGPAEATLIIWGAYCHHSFASLGCGLMQTHQFTFL